MGYNGRMATRQAVVLASGHSRRGKEALEAIPSLLVARGIEILDAHMEPTHESLAKAVKKAMKAGTKLIVVCGGDGTQTHVVPLFAKKSYTLGIVPAGSGNSGVAPKALRVMVPATSAIPA